MKHIKSLTCPRPAATWWEIRQIVEVVIGTLSQLVMIFRQIGDTKEPN